MTERVVLTEFEKKNPIMEKVRAHLEYRLEMLRAENDVEADERATAKTRGSIAEVKAMLGLFKERPNL